MQLMSDFLISKEGKLGTVRKESDPQTVSLYYGNKDLEVPIRHPEYPTLGHRFAMGAFTRSFETIFFR